MQELKTQKREYEDTISSLGGQITAMKEENHIVEGSKEEALYNLVVKKYHKEELTEEEQAQLLEMENIGKYESIVSMEAERKDMIKEIRYSFKHGDGTLSLKRQLDDQIKKVVGSSIQAADDDSMEKVNEGLKEAIDEIGKQTLLEAADMRPIAEIVEKLNGIGNEQATEETLKGNIIDELG